ncbi:MAG: TonB-dependent receptor [Cyclobacteriaceae bacterium]
MKKLISNLFLLSVLCHAAFAQRTVSGRVSTDGSTLGLEQVTVQVKGQSTTAITDYDGNYEINISGDQSILVFALAGFQTIEMSVGALAVLDVKMVKSSKEKGEESISVGFGTQSKSEMTSSVASINTESLASQPVVDLEQANQGRASGMLVQNKGGKLGEGTSVTIRGGSSLTGSNSPLYVVDGVPLSSDNQSEINPANIASMQVLKDASAAAIYGSRAANGVIIITTKGGQSGKMKVDVDYQFGAGQAPKRLNLMGPDEYKSLLLEYGLREGALQLETIAPFSQDARDELELFDAILASASQENLQKWHQEGRFALDDGSTIEFTDGSLLNTLKSRLDSNSFNTNWQEEIFRTAPSHRANINVSGGSEKFNYFAGVGYTDQTGILVGNSYNRFNGNLNLRSQASAALSIGGSLNFSHSVNNRLNDDQDLGSPLQAIVLPPSDSYDPNNEYKLRWRSLEYNPLTEINFSDNIETSDRLLANLNIGYGIMEGLKFNLDGGVDYLDYRAERRQGPETLDGKPTGLSRLTQTNIFNYTVNGYFSYDAPVGGNKLSAILGSSYQLSETQSDFRLARVNSIEDLESKTGADADLFNPPIPNTGFSFLSYFTRVNYSIDSKYTLQVSARMDGSSKFGQENRYGVFPAASAGWNLSEESFLQGSSSINFLKLKASYGLVGNTPDDDFIYRSNYFTVNYGVEEAYRLSNLSNPDLKWETTAQLDVGLDFGLFGDRVTGNVDYYIKNTTDLLFPVPVSMTSGFDLVLKNVGAMENKGVEFVLSSVNVSSGDFSWYTDFNISMNRNKITDLGGDNLISGVNTFREGEPMGVFYMPEFLGVDPLTGLAQYDNGSGGITNDYDIALANGRKVVGNPNPDFFGGLGNTLSYKNIDLSFLFQFVQGIDMYNQTGEFLANSGILTLNQKADQLDRWYKSRDESTYPVLDPRQENTYPSSRWLEDGSFIRLNTATLTFNLPQDMIAGWKMSYFKIYVGGQNLLTFTKYSGYDPDVNFVSSDGGTLEANISRGIDDFTTPQARTITTGIKIGF